MEDAVSSTEEKMFRPLRVEVDPVWTGKVAGRAVVSVTGGVLGDFYSAYATSGGGDPLTGWSADHIYTDWSPGTSDAVLKGATQVTSGSPPGGATKYSMGAWGGKLIKSLGTDQALFEIYEGKLSGGTWVKTGARLGVLCVRSDGLEYHKAASGSPASISGDRTLDLFLESVTDVDLDPGSGNHWWSAVDPKI